MKTLDASEFKARCTAFLDEVYQTRETITITKRGKPVAQLGPPLVDQDGYPQESLAGSVTILGDIESPAVQASEWDAESGSS